MEKLDTPNITEAMAKELRDRREQQRRLECLLFKHVKASDEKLTDGMLVREVIRRWADYSGLTVSIGVVER